jgi:CheY-like chemotaxis protein
MPARKLLVADDSLTIQKVIRLALSSAPGDGYEIQAVSDGNDAIQQISLFRPDLVLVDVSLPVRTAFEIKAEMAAHADLQHVRYILMSSAFESYDEEQAQRLGFHGKLSKPFDPALLRKVLQDALDTAPARNVLPVAQVTVPTAPASDWLEEVPPPATAPEAPDADIRSLTESTIRLSGLEGMEWSIDDSAKKILPTGDNEQVEFARSAASPPEPVEEAYTEISESTLTRLRRQVPVVPPLDGFRELSGASFRPGFSEQPVESLGALGPANEWDVSSSGSVELSEEPADAPRLAAGKWESYGGLSLGEGDEGASAAGDFGSSVGSAEFRGSAATLSPSAALGEATLFSTDQIEDLVRKQVQESLARLAERVLPEIAERVIKQEISRLLQEGPGS